MQLFEIKAKDILALIFNTFFLMHPLFQAAKNAWIFLKQNVHICTKYIFPDKKNPPIQCTTS